MSKLRRRHIDTLAAKLDDITHAIIAVRRDVERSQENEARRLRDVPSLREDFVRVEALLGGVRVALERMGGTTLPGFREDVSGLRAQMNELQHEMSDYRGVLMKICNYAEAMHIRHATDNPEPPAKPRRRPGRPKKDTSQKLIDEPEQEVADEA